MGNFDLNTTKIRIHTGCSRHTERQSSKETIVLNEKLYNISLLLLKFICNPEKLS